MTARANEDVARSTLVMAKSAESPSAGRRHKLADLLIVVLVGVAFEEMAGPMSRSLANGVFPDLLLLAVFVFTAIRFFVGDLFHLLNNDFADNPKLWLFDFAWIVVQMTLLIFLGALSTTEESEGKRVHFVTILTLLIMVDLLWITSQWLLGLLYTSWRRLGSAKIPWKWAYINFFLLAGIVILRMSVRDCYELISLVLLATFNLLAFIADIYFADFSHLFEEDVPNRSVHARRNR